MTALRRMTQPKFERWLAQAVAAFAEDKIASGQWARDEAMARSAQEHAELLPDGPSTADNHLYTLVDEAGTAVGMLWFAVTSRFDAPVAYVYNIEVEPGQRRRGHARRGLLALEQEARRLGLNGVALHVFGHNTGAQALYAGLGYGPTNISLFKPLAATDD